MDGAGALTIIQCLKKELPLPVSFSPRAAFPRLVKKGPRQMGVTPPFRDGQEASRFDPEPFLRFSMSKAHTGRFGGWWLLPER